ncbi:uncharacterized protein EDB93DRAFT_561669 [Suillus bovinus]|uniref:uncharacterized protein n=1 Tax=Suillus bovinus TaxID=48563 RepID=UPI001B85CF3E|nr:uncharacterized protein EDB93DRAFT_561669 [Suillus bovinus]KAG2158686.1 hypothetical protein EDB93DRAFT_561669 [Suillus bovinus]
MMTRTSLLTTFIPHPSNTPSLTNIMSLNALTYPSQGLENLTSSSSHWQNSQKFHSTTHNYDQGDSVSQYDGHQLQRFATPPLGPDLIPLMAPSPSAAESSQVVFATQSTNQLISIPLQSHFPLLLLRCRWVCQNIPCMFTGTLEELKAHCRAGHFAGPKDVPIACQWENCTYYKRGDRTVHVMRRDSIWRHTSEKHLFLKRGM